MEPLLTFEAIETAIPKAPFDAIALTSATALSFSDLKDHVNKPVFATGTATMDKAIAQGFTNVKSSNGGALELAALIRNRYSGQPARVLYPSALEPAHDLADLLKPHDITCINWPVYKTVERGHFSCPTLELFKKGKIDLILLYSRRTAQSFATLWAKQMSKEKSPHLLAISQNVQDALPQYLAQMCIVSTDPNESSMRQKIKDIFHQD